MTSIFKTTKLTTLYDVDDTYCFIPRGTVFYAPPVSEWGNTIALSSWLSGMKFEMPVDVEGNRLLHPDFEQFTTHSVYINTEPVDRDGFKIERGMRWRVMEYGTWYSADCVVMQPSDLQHEWNVYDSGIYFGECELDPNDESCLFTPYEPDKAIQSFDADILAQSLADIKRMKLITNNRLYEEASNGNYLSGLGDLSDYLNEIESRVGLILKYYVNINDQSK